MLIIPCLCLHNECVALLIYIFPQRSSNRFTGKFNHSHFPIHLHTLKEAQHRSWWCHFIRKISSLQFHVFNWACNPSCLCRKFCAAGRWVEPRLELGFQDQTGFHDFGGVFISTRPGALAGGSHTKSRASLSSKYKEDKVCCWCCLIYYTFPTSLSESLALVVFSVQFWGRLSRQLIFWFVSVFLAKKEKSQLNMTREDLLEMCRERRNCAMGLLRRSGKANYVRNVD